MVMVCTWFIYIWATYIHSLSWNKAIWGWFPLLTIIYGGRNEVVIIYPDNFKSTDLRWLKRCNRRVLLGNPQSSALFPFRLQILWCTYPSEKYDSQLGWLFPIYGKKNMFQTTNQYLSLSWSTCIPTSTSIWLSYTVVLHQTEIFQVLLLFGESDQLHDNAWSVNKLRCPT